MNLVDADGETGQIGAILQAESTGHGDGLNIASEREVLSKAWLPGVWCESLGEH